LASSSTDTITIGKARATHKARATPPNPEGDPVKRTYVLLLGVLLSAASVSAVASAQRGRPTADAARVAKVGVRHTTLGTILVSASGRTLYEFTRDRPHRNSCVKISGCSEIWPALTTSGKPTAGPGVRASLLSTIKLPGGAKQVTYAGHALYLYSADSGPGETSYVGERAFGGIWYAINSAGHTVK
jgi:predicted lipoprotein with Yx(FWY)xxD motif